VKMKIMLATPPGSTTELWPPLGLLYIAASINERRGDEVKVVDAFCRGMQGDDLVKEVLATRPDVLGMNCSTHTFLDTVKALAKISESAPDTLIVLGGYHATFTAKRILRTYPFIDYVIKGEAERSFVDLLNALEEGRSPSNVDGIVYLDGKELVERPYKLIEDLDSLPAIDRDLLQGVEYGYGIKGTIGTVTFLSIFLNRNQ
jgi:anaerobic magnesium-protoporphyrin IX monomethyl ester cyclase